MNKTFGNFLRRQRHRGFSLVAVMIIMVIVSLLGVAGSQLVLLGERSSRYDRDWQIAYQAAEAALLDAVVDIKGPNKAATSRTSDFANNSRAGFLDGCGKTGVDRGLCEPSIGPKPIWYQIDFTDKSATAPSTELGEFTDGTFPTGSVGVQPAMLPRYIIEVIEDQSPGFNAKDLRVLHRVTAMGFGPNTDTQAVLQMVFRKN